MIDKIEILIFKKIISLIRLLMIIGYIIIYLTYYVMIS